MKSRLTFALGIALSVTCLPADAQTYQWKDSSGRTVISDTPPPNSTKGARTIESAPATASAERGSTKETVPKSVAEKEMEFRKRQQELRTKEEKQTTDEARARERQELCEQARRQAAVLNSNQWVVTANAGGQQQVMDKAMREQEIERLNKQIADQCN